MDIRNLQATVTAGSCSSRVIFNVPDARSAGLEFEVAAQPTPLFDVALSASVADARLQAGHVTGIIAGIEDGKRLPTTPRFQMAVGDGQPGRLSERRVPARRIDPGVVRRRRARHRYHRGHRYDHGRDRLSSRPVALRSCRTNPDGTWVSRPRDRAAGFGLTRWLYAQGWTGTERPSARVDRATPWMLAHTVVWPGATTLARVVAKLRPRVDGRVWRGLARGISPPPPRRREDRWRGPDEGRSSSLVTRRTGAAMVRGPALVRALERLNAVRRLSITVPAAAAIAPPRMAALARGAEKANVTAGARLPA